MTALPPAPLARQPWLGFDPEEERPARDYAPGMGQAVADRTVNRTIETRFDPPRRIPFALPRHPHIALDAAVAAWAKTEGYVFDGSFQEGRSDADWVTGHILATARRQPERWADVAERVALGSALLDPRAHRRDAERENLRVHLRQATVLLSGRHLQHGDETQPTRNMEVFTNCATAATSFMLFLLLLNGSGVGRAYDDAMIAVDFARDMPVVVPAIGWGHADVSAGHVSGYLTPEEARHLHAHATDIVEHTVADSREGWAKAVEFIERLAFEKRRDAVLILDFSQVRPKGAPIMGMQGRPASGPGPFMAALSRVARVRDSGMSRWRAALYVDHYLAECVLVGGARRAARMSTKAWRDPSALDFVAVKRGGFLWSSNNSITVDSTFWAHAQSDDPPADPALHAEWAHARAVFGAAAHAAYHDGTGEPGFINQHMLVANNEGLDEYLRTGKFCGSAKYQVDEATAPLMVRLAQAAAAAPFPQITNPCGEISLFMLGGYCVVGDVVPYHADDDAEAEDAFRAATRALIRTNLMDCLYAPETRRTNRIGVGLTGLHEYALARFGLGFRDLLNLDASLPFWRMLARFRRAVHEEAVSYSAELGLVSPHTESTVKPAGTTSKLFGLTEGVHLPSMRAYLRWVQFRNDDPMVADYAARGYPVKKLRSYSNTTIVGFPTQPEIVRLAERMGMADAIVTAAEATPEEQFRFLQLLERFWIRGEEADGTPLQPDTGNQVSYTLKYDPKEVSFEAFRAAVLAHQPHVRCVSVMPQTDVTAYEYQPEEPISAGAYHAIAETIAAAGQATREEVAREHVDCSTGACPIDFREERTA
jgi:adenosylcobalamin-dependent ribonucleoside-triphosphate reductase